MAEPLLGVSAECKGRRECVYGGEDLFFEVNIVAQGARVEFPLAYVRETGPIVRLVDERTGTDTFLRRNLADPALQADLTAIEPGRSVSFPWVITADELEQFPGERVAVRAEVTVMTDIRVDGRTVEFRGTGALKVHGAKRATR